MISQAVQQFAHAIQQQELTDEEICDLSEALYTLIEIATRTKIRQILSARTFQELDDLKAAADQVIDNLNAEPSFLFDLSQDEDEIPW